MSDYPDDLDVRPLTTWPGALTAASDRRRAPFRAGLSSTLALLRVELRALRCDRPVLEVAIPDQPDLWRIDGRPRARAWAEHPGVVLALPRTAVGPLRYATDTFDSWQDNLRAIAKGLEALRAVDRYGITKRGEQYAGFKALPAGSGAVPMGAAPALTESQARARVFMMSGVAGGGDLAVAVRRAKRQAHPDSQQGSRMAWDSLMEALEVLGVG